MADYNFPTEVIELPSKGLIYPEGHPLSKGQVEIKYMTAKEEDILASQNLIRKGVVLDKLFESIVVDKDVNIGDIFIGDKNAILLATRILGYGAEYKVEVSDPFSGEPQKVSIDLSKVQTKEVDESLLNRENSYSYTLPSGKNIKFRLLTHKDEQDINAEIQALNRLTKGDSAISQDVTTRLRYMITEIDGNDDKGFIVFDTDDFENRQYVYEKDVLYAFSIPAYQNTGSRSYALLQYKFSKKLQIWARYAQFRYVDQFTVGTGNEEIEGNTRSEVKFQMMLRF